jgi:RHS repeat-associated protein
MTPIRHRLTDAAGYTSSYSYDSLNRLTGLTNTNSGSFGFGYDALGRRTSLTRPNGVNTSYSYDTLSRLLGVLHNGGALPGSASYTYDAAGNRLTKTAVQEASPNPVSVLSQYSYDNIYELTQALVNGSVAEDYTYDAVGNRLTSAGPTSYNYNPSNELTSTSAATYAYDNNGNTILKTTTAGTTSYTWDFENRLASVTLPGTGGTVNFKYDPFGRRIEKIAPTSGTTVYAYDGDNITEELGGGGNQLAYFTQGPSIDEPLALTGTGGTHFYHPDGVGSITSLTDGSGQLAVSYVYDSFGNLTSSTGTLTNPFQYTAREFDSETGLYYYRARFYDSGTGRFLSVDPVFHLNAYHYVGNKPTTYVDPSGADIAVVGDVSSYAQAIQYLLRDPVIAPIIHSLQTSEDIITLMTTDSTDPNVLGYTKQNKTILWNPHGALRCIGENARGSLSPAVALAHELVHAYMDTWYNFTNAETNDDYHFAQDKYIIENFEHHLIDLGEGIRYNHRGVIYYVPSPTGR